MSNSIDNQILDVLAKHTKIGREKITDSTPLEMLGVDSLLMVEIIFDLEELFDISIPDPASVGEKRQQFETAADVIGIVKELIEEQKSS